MKTISRFQVPENAYLFRAFLESHDLPAQVLDEHVVQLFWHYSDAIGGVRVVTADEHSHQAKELHREYQALGKKEPSTESMVRAWPLVLLASYLIGAPVLLFGRKTL